MYVGTWVAYPRFTGGKEATSWCRYPVVAGRERIASDKR